LKVLRADAVMDAAQPGFEIGEYEVDDRQEGFCDLRIAPFWDGGMAIGVLGQFGIAAPVVGEDGGTGGNRALNESAQRLGASVGHQGEPNTPSVPSVLRLLRALSRFRCRTPTAPATRTMS